MFYFDWDVVQGKSSDMLSEDFLSCYFLKADFKNASRGTAAHKGDKPACSSVQKKQHLLYSISCLLHTLFFRCWDYKVFLHPPRKKKKKKVGTEKHIVSWKQSGLSDGL